jgi:hypothetical protein
MGGTAIVVDVPCHLADGVAARVLIATALIAGPKTSNFSLMPVILADYVSPHHQRVLHPYQRSLHSPTNKV